LLAFLTYGVGLYSSTTSIHLTAYIVLMKMDQITHSRDRPIFIRNFPR